MNASARPVHLSDYTTLRLGGTAPRLDSATDDAEVARLIGGCDASDEPVLVLGGGSNLVVADAGVPYPVVKVDIPGITVEAAEDGSALVRAGAGVNFDDLVAETVAAGYAELAPLSGIPGSVGATPVQNVGAYGAEVSQMLASVRLYDRRLGRLHTVLPADLDLAYRRSNLRGTDRAVVVAVSFLLHRGPTTVAYAELARSLSVKPGDGAPPAAVREAVLDLRRGKGMVLDAADPDTVSAGSFFTNPILDRTALSRTLAAIQSELGPDAVVPQYPVGTTALTKLSAAWLIERAGFGRGFAGPGGRVAVSGKHSLALTNRGGATTADLLELARTIRDGVDAAFAVRLRPEPVLVGVDWDA